MSHTSNPPADAPHWHEALAAAHPGYDFERYETGDGLHWAATALHLGTHPWCVVTGEPREFDAYLPAIPADQLSQLEGDYPGVRFGTVWASAASGRPRRRYWARRIADGALFTAPSPQALRERIEAESTDHSIDTAE
jgi:hypothetical protein